MLVNVYDAKICPFILNERSHSVCCHRPAANESKLKSTHFFPHPWLRRANNCVGPSTCHALLHNKWTKREINWPNWSHSSDAQCPNKQTDPKAGIEVIDERARKSGTLSPQRFPRLKSIACSEQCKNIDRIHDKSRATRSLHRGLPWNSWYVYLQRPTDAGAAATGPRWAGACRRAPCTRAPAWRGCPASSCRLWLCELKGVRSFGRERKRACSSAQQQPATPLACPSPALWLLAQMENAPPAHAATSPSVLLLCNQSCALALCTRRERKAPLPCAAAGWGGEKGGRERERESGAPALLAQASTQCARGFLSRFYPPIYSLCKIGLDVYDNILAQKTIIMRL